MSAAITRLEFEELYRATAPELLAYIARHSTGDPEDLVSEIFMTAWRRRAALPPAVLRRAWLFGTARKLMLAERRRYARSKAAAEALADDDIPDSATDDNNAKPVVESALARLTPEQREVIELSEWQRLTPTELAVALGVRAGTARVRLHRARQALAADQDLTAFVAMRSRQTAARGGERSVARVGNEGAAVPR